MDLKAGAKEKFGHIVSREKLEKTAEKLCSNGMEAYVVDDGEAAKQMVLEMIPSGEQVFNMTSQTLEKISLVEEILHSGRYKAVRLLLEKLEGLEKRKLGAVPEWVIGSVHAVTEEGQVLIASKTGSQIPAYVYGATHVIWVVGAQKIVKDLESGLQRIYEYSLPLEDKRARQAYGVGSEADKILIVNKEITPGRIKVILVDEELGF